MHALSYFLLALSTLLFACSAPSPAAAPADAGADVPPSDACVAVAEASDPVTVDNAYGRLEGTLDVPGGCAGLPVVVILSGSGSQDRDGGDPEIYRHLAAGLHAAGIASLRFDDPGVGGSSGAVPDDVTAFNYDAEVDSAGRWLPLLRRDARFGKIILAGHSMGSLTAALLAQRGGVDAIISLAGAGRPIGVVLREQLAPRLTSDQLVALDAALAKLVAGELPGPLESPLDSILPVQAQPYMMSWMKYDPAAEFAKVTVPALIAQGKTDLQVAVLDANRLAEAKPDAELLILDDMMHTLRKAVRRTSTSQQELYSDPTIPLHEALVARVNEFVRVSAGFRP